MDPVLQQLATQPRSALLALDFDGTLAPIISDPDRSRPVAGVIEALEQLASAGVQVAIVTGRDALTALRLGGLARIPDVIVSGLHGAQTWHDGELKSLPEPPGIAELRVLLPPMLAQVDSRIWLEDKGLSLVVHTRRAPDPSGALHQLKVPLEAAASAHGLEVHRGKLVWEIRIPGLSKADAVRALLEQRPGTRTAVFAGDDDGDLPAFAEIQRWRVQSRDESASRLSGLTIAVGEIGQVSEFADLSVPAPQDLADLLLAVAEQL